MTDSKIESAKKRLSSGVPPKDVVKEPRRIHFDAIALAARLSARLAYGFPVSRDGPLSEHSHSILHIG